MYFHMSVEMNIRKANLFLSMGGGLECIREMVLFTLEDSFLFFFPPNDQC